MPLSPAQPPGALARLGLIFTNGGNRSAPANPTSRMFSYQERPILQAAYLGWVVFGVYLPYPPSLRASEMGARQQFLHQ